jgi:diaminohydroxyphosphoribosylaminopyrimidine deaminase / 5-amino-6-(5-phosphoribosylamino)uracil reductase
MQRCLGLASLGSGQTAPNPLVGSVLVHKDNIIGEGYHVEFGKSHAEVNCIHSVSNKNKQLLPQSTLYVSLEPCVHFGKTPPCTDLIISSGIPEVVIGCRDSFSQVNGRGIEKLEKAGVKVVYGILEAECRDKNRRFFTFHEQGRPHIVLKWAETADEKIAGENGSRLKISNELTDRLVHKWRMEESAILVGTRTALLDDPGLTNRHWKGPSPVRLVIDKKLKLPASLKIFNIQQRTIIFNGVKEAVEENLCYVLIQEEENLPKQIAEAMFRLNIQSVLVEGGAVLLQSFIDAGLWDEARIIRNPEMIAGDGVPAPVLKENQAVGKEETGGDEITFFKKNKT